MDACRDVRQDVAQRQTLHEWIGSIRRHFSFAVSSAMVGLPETKTGYLRVLLLRDL